MVSGQARASAPAVASNSHNDGWAGSGMMSDRDREVTFLSGLGSLINIDRAFCEIFTVIIPVSLLDWIMPEPSQTIRGAGALRLLLKYYNPSLFIFQNRKSLANIKQTKVIVPGTEQARRQAASDLLRIIML